MLFRLLVRGPRACFRRPEFAIDLVTYDILTPFAARGMFDTVYRAPGVRWRIERLRVLNPIVTRWVAPAVHGVRGSTASVSIRHALAHTLVDVAYVIEARLEHAPRAATGDDLAAHERAVRRRLADDRHPSPPYLGLREFAAETGMADEHVPGAYDGSGAIDLGWMIHDLDPEGANRFRFFRAIMYEGVIDLTAPEGLMLAS